MYEVKVARGALLERITVNRDGHRAAFEKALEEYRLAVVAELEDWLKRARAGENVARRTVLVQPQDRTADYNRVIDMLEMSVDGEITLDAQSFARYVRDEWEWKDQFASAVMGNRTYLANSAG